MTVQLTESPGTVAPVVPVAPVVTEPVPDPPDADATAVAAALGDAGKRALDAIRKERDDARTKLKELESRDLTELEKAQQAAASSAQRLALLESQNLRQRVALAQGLPATLVDRLQGSTEDEMAADAVVLLGMLNRPRTPTPDPGQGPRPSTPEALADAEYEKFYPSSIRK